MKITRYVLSILIILTSLFSAGCVALGPTPNPKPHLIEQDQVDANPVRYVDTLTETAEVTGNTIAEQLDSLAEILYTGQLKPVFTSANQTVIDTYTTARNILNRYIKSNFSTYEKVHAIHDYLVYYVSYDFELMEQTLSGVVSNDLPQFNANGALLNKKAVCDGLSKAFIILCGIEGIRAIRITGDYFDTNYNASIPHAWNKVTLDGYNWYNVDVTMDSFSVKKGNSYTSYLTHGYFLVSDDSICDNVTGRHTIYVDENPVNYACTADYEFHASNYLITTETKTYTMKITSQQQLNDVFKTIYKQGKKTGKIEIQLAFDGYDESNLSSANAYVSELKEAYSLVKDADYVFSTTGENVSYPFARYPRGVFFVLIYK